MTLVLTIMGLDFVSIIFALSLGTYLWKTLLYLEFPNQRVKGGLSDLQIEGFPCKFQVKISVFKLNFNLKTEIFI